MRETEAAEDQSGESEMHLPRRRVLTGCVAVAAGVAGCLSEDGDTDENTGDDESTDDSDEQMEVSPEVTATEIAFVTEDGDPFTKQAAVTVNVDGPIETDSLPGRIQTPTETHRLNFERERPGEYTAEVDAGAEGEYTAEVTADQVEGDPTALTNSAQYHVTDGLTFDQNDEAPGIVEARLEPDNTTAGTLEQLAAETLEATAQVNGETRDITLQKDGANGYTANINIYRNGEIIEDVQVEVEKPGQLENLQLQDGKLTGNTAETINPQRKITAEEAYRETYNTSNEPVTQDQLDHVQNGEITDFGQLIKEMNIYATGSEGAMHQDYKEIGHNVLNLDRDRFRAVSREGTADSAYTAVFYRQNTDQDWNKALVRAMGTDKYAEQSVLLPTETNPSEFLASAKKFLYGYHNPEDEYERTPLDFIQNVQTIEEYDTKEKKTEEEWKDYTEEFDKFNDMLIPGEREGIVVEGYTEDVDIGYTEDVRGYMQGIIHPRNGDINKEVKLVEKASEYGHNAVPEGMYMQIDVAGETPDKGEKLVELEDGNVMYATTVDEETHQENVMELYDPDVAS